MVHVGEVEAFGTGHGNGFCAWRKARWVYGYTYDDDTNFFGLGRWVGGIVLYIMASAYLTCDGVVDSEWIPRICAGSDTLLLFPGSLARVTDALRTSLDKCSL
jgi:hypothetical protein